MGHEHTGDYSPSLDKLIAHMAELRSGLVGGHEVPSADLIRQVSLGDLPAWHQSMHPETWPSETDAVRRFRTAMGALEDVRSQLSRISQDYAEVTANLQAATASLLALFPDRSRAILSGTPLRYCRYCGEFLEQPQGVGASQWLAMALARPLGAGLWDYTGTEKCEAAKSPDGLHHIAEER